MRLNMFCINRNSFSFLFFPMSLSLWHYPTRHFYLIFRIQDTIYGNWFLIQRFTIDKNNYKPWTMERDNEFTCLTIVDEDFFINTKVMLVVGGNKKGTQITWVTWLLFTKTKEVGLEFTQLPCHDKKSSWRNSDNSGSLSFLYMYIVCVPGMCVSLHIKNINVIKYIIMMIMQFVSSYSRNHWMSYNHLKHQRVKNIIWCSSPMELLTLRNEEQHLYTCSFQDQETFHFVWICQWNI